MLFFCNLFFKFFGFVCSNMMPRTFPAFPSPTRRNFTCWSQNTYDSQNQFRLRIGQDSDSQAFHVCQCQWTLVPAMLWFLFVWVTGGWSRCGRNIQKSDRKDAQYQDYCCITTVPLQAGHRNTTPNMSENVRNTFQRTGKLCQRTISQFIIEALPLVHLRFLIKTTQEKVVHRTSSALTTVSWGCVHTLEHRVILEISSSSLTSKSADRAIVDFPSPYSPLQKFSVHRFVTVTFRQWLVSKKRTKTVIRSMCHCHADTWKTIERPRSRIKKRWIEVFNFKTLWTF